MDRWATKATLEPEDTIRQGSPCSLQKNPMPDTAQAPWLPQLLSNSAWLRERSGKGPHRAIPLLLRSLRVGSFLGLKELKSRYLTVFAPLHCTSGARAASPYTKALCSSRPSPPPPTTSPSSVSKALPWPPLPSSRQ